MNFAETFSIAVRAIFLNKTRSFLTMLGVIIGVGAVILLVAIGNGIQEYVVGQFDKLGANTITIMPGDIFGSGGGFSSSNSAAAFASNKLRLSDVVAIRKLRPTVTKVAPVMLSQSEVGFRQKKEKTSIIGTTQEFAEIRHLEMEKGVMWTNTDSAAKKKVAIIGFKIAEQLFGNIDPVGKKIQVNGQAFTVVGVMKEIGSSFGGPEFDTYVVLPLDTYRGLYNTETVTQIIAQSQSKDNVKEAISMIKQTLGKRLKSDEFSVIEVTEILKTINQILGVLTVGLGGIAAISLVVGGIGIMNIMLVSVAERTREIGLRKALGATPTQILLQFLIESSLLSVFGGCIGVLLAFLLSLVIRIFIPASITLSAIGLAFSVSAAIGIIFGVAPARRASQLSPIEALRYE